ncbi:MAG: hypothetical protein LBC89_02855 [Bacteroidales bacterium]|nr:hypothetical protein [Bacteroidales bacterium]
MTGVKREVFEQMLEVLNESKAKLRKHPSRGTPAKLSNADKLLLLLSNLFNIMLPKSRFSRLFGKLILIE